MNWPDALVLAAIVGGIAWYAVEENRSETRLRLELQRRNRESRAARKESKT